MVRRNKQHLNPGRVPETWRGVRGRSARSGGTDAVRPLKRGWLEVDAAPGFLPIAIARGFEAFGATVFLGFFRLSSILRSIGSYGWLRWQHRLLIVLVHDSSLWVKGWSTGDHPSPTRQWHPWQSQELCSCGNGVVLVYISSGYYASHSPRTQRASDAPIAATRELFFN